MGRGITRALAKANAFWLGAYALSSAFIVYFSMYAFRKPFTVGTYHAVAGWSAAIDFKVAAVICQVLGYALSKLIGVKLVSEAEPSRRAITIVALIIVSELALVAFAIAPPEWKLVAIFFNGLPLGMIWGLVFGFLEGRRSSELLGAGLCTSFIVSSGVVKSVGSWLIVDQHVPEFWMPAATGLLFLPVLALSVVMLSLTPPPNEQDKAERMERSPMRSAERRAFLEATAAGLVALTIAFVALSALRDFRDNFAVEIWNAVGYKNAPAIFSVSELPAALVVLVLLGATVAIRNNRNAVIVIHLLMAGGGLVVAGSTLLFQLGLIGPAWWMVILGAGIYVGYVPGTSILADRLTAAMRLAGNAGFFMYVLDAAGYGGSVALLLFKEFGVHNLSWLNFFIQLNYGVAALAVATTLVSLAYFSRRAKAHAAPATAETLVTA